MSNRCMKCCKRRGTKSKTVQAVQNVQIVQYVSVRSDFRDDINDGRVAEAFGQRFAGFGDDGEVDDAFLQRHHALDGAASRRVVR